MRSSVTKIEALMGEIHRVLNAQVNLIIHESQFQRLESAWRGLQNLANGIGKNRQVLLRYFHLTYQEFNRDMTQAVELEQSVLFKKIYIDELDQPGGMPFGLLVGDYYFSHLPHNEVHDGMGALQQMAKIAAASFAPFVSSVAAQFLGLDSFSELTNIDNLDNQFKAPEYRRWLRLRENEHANFLILTLPRILGRVPYNLNGGKFRQRWFQEQVQKHEDYLWSNASYAYAELLINSYLNTGWFSSVSQQDDSGKTMSAITLPRHYFRADTLLSLPKIATECLVSDRADTVFSNNGLLALRDHRYADLATFYSCQTVKTPENKKGSNPDSQMNTLVHYVLCASRFAQYIKVMIRDKVGSFTTSQTCESFLRRWINQYTSTLGTHSDETVSRRPLSKASIHITETPTAPGKYYCAITISPHFRFDDIQANLKFITQVRIN